MAETYVNKFMDKKNDRIQQLKDQVHEVREGKKSEREYSKHLKSYYRQRKTSIQLWAPDTRKEVVVDHVDFPFRLMSV